MVKTQCVLVVQVKLITDLLALNLDSEFKSSSSLPLCLIPKRSMGWACAWVPGLPLSCVVWSELAKI